jgi:hypothetical protein
MTASNLQLLGAGVILPLKNGGVNEGVSLDRLHSSTKNCIMHSIFFVNQAHVNVFVVQMREHSC